MSLAPQKPTIIACRLLNEKQPLKPEFVPEECATCHTAIQLSPNGRWQRQREGEGKCYCLCHRCTDIVISRRADNGKMTGVMLGQEAAKRIEEILGELN